MPEAARSRPGTGESELDLPAGAKVLHLVRHGRSTANEPVPGEAPTAPAVPSGRSERGPATDWSRAGAAQLVTRVLTPLA